MSDVMMFNGASFDGRIFKIFYFFIFTRVQIMTATMTPFIINATIYMFVFHFYYWFFTFIIYFYYVLLHRVISL